MVVVLAALEVAVPFLLVVVAIFVARRTELVVAL